jgi:hypothetical protein
MLETKLAKTACFGNVYDEAAMVATHGGIVVPPRDGDGISSDADGELLAQIIPLRRRQSEPGAPEILADEPAGPLEGPEALPSSSVERSVWDQPSVDLRRRAPNGPASGGPAADTRLLGHRSLARFLTGAAAIAAVGAIAVVVALALGGATGRSGPRPQKYAASRLTPRVGLVGFTGRASSHSRRSAAAHHQTHPRRAAALNVAAQSTGVKSAAPPSTLGSSAPAQERAPADNAPVSSSPQPVAQSAPASGYTPVSEPSAESASTNREFGFER